MRVAAETAGRLAAGDLSQRIAVRGSDDLARLGQSFNDMAGSLQRQIRRLEDLSRLQRRFTSDVSHELRTPLTTVRMAAELLYAEPRRVPAGAGPVGRAAARPSSTGSSRCSRTCSRSRRYDAGVAHLESEPADMRGRRGQHGRAQSVLAERHGSEIDRPPAATSR